MPLAQEPPPEMVEFVNGLYQERGAATKFAAKINVVMGVLRRVSLGKTVSPASIKRIQKHMPAPTTTTEVTTAPVANALVPTKGKKGKAGELQSALAAALIGAHPEPEDEVVLRVSRFGQALVDSMQFAVLSMNQFVTEEIRGLQRRKANGSRAG